MSDLIKCNICGGYHPWKIIQAVQKPGRPWEAYCPIYSYFDNSFGWRITYHVDTQEDEKSQDREIIKAWYKWIFQQGKEAFIQLEYDIVCTTCHRNFISFYPRSVECFRCSTRKEEL